MNHTPLAQRLNAIEPFHVMALLGRARALEAEGRDIVHMEIGEPDFATAEPVVAAGIKALQGGMTQYTPAAGLPALREAIAGHYQDQYGVEVEPRRIFVTPGASGALLLALALLVDPDDEVLLPDPGYPCNRHFVSLLNGRPVSVPVDGDSNFQIHAEHVAARWGAKTRAAMVGSPSNPTGTLLDAAALAALADAVSARGGMTIVDEIYHGLTYGEEPQTAASRRDDTLVVNSFSKYFGMTGWRLGWLVVPERLVAHVEKLAQNIYIAASTPAQYAALACFTPAAREIFEQRRAAFQARRDYLLPALQGLGIEFSGEPKGAFYLYGDCAKLCANTYTLAQELLEMAGVAVTPGLDFGAYNADRHMRFAYTNSLERLAEGVKRIEVFLRGENRCKTP